jgi:hypothetical protein
MFHRPVDKCARGDCNMTQRAVPGDNDVFTHSDGRLKNFVRASGENRALELVRLNRSIIAKRNAHCLWVSCGQYISENWYRYPRSSRHKLRILEKDSS